MEQTYESLQDFAQKRIIPHLDGQDLPAAQIEKIASRMTFIHEGNLLEWTERTPEEVIQDVIDNWETDWELRDVSQLTHEITIPADHGVSAFGLKLRSSDHHFLPRLLTRLLDDANDQSWNPGAAFLVDDIRRAGGNLVIVVSDYGPEDLGSFKVKARLRPLPGASDLGEWLQLSHDPRG